MAVEASTCPLNSAQVYTNGLNWLLKAFVYRYHCSVLPHPNHSSFHWQLRKGSLSKQKSLILQIGTCIYPIFSPLPSSFTNFSVSKILKQQIYHSSWETSIQSIAKRNHFFSACIWKTRRMEKLVGTSAQFLAATKGLASFYGLNNQTEQ